MESENLISEYLGHAFGGERGVRRNGVHLLGEPVHYDADGIEAIRWRGRSDEVDGHRVPGAFWNCMWSQWCIEKHTSWLGALTCIAPSHIAAHILADSGPVVVARDEFQGFGMSWVSCQWCVVVSSDQIVSEFLALGNIDASLECD